MTNTSWPKKMPVLTEKQQKIRSEFMQTWLTVYPDKYSFMEEFNHRAIFKGHRLPKSCKTLEIGAGIGAHITYEDLKAQEYYALEIRQDFVDQIKAKFPNVIPVCGDIQQGLDFPDHYFDRILAIHVLEHLPNLPAALTEIKRLLKPGGYCEFILPCEGSLAYSLAREISAKRLFKKRYPGVSYDIFIKSEHVNTYADVAGELRKSGLLAERMVYFPFPLPLIFCNLAVGLRCRLK